MPKIPNIHLFQARALATWQSEVRLLEKEALTHARRFTKYALPLPETMKEDNRAVPIYARVLPEKLERARVLLNDPQGPNIQVTQMGDTWAAEEDKERVQNFCAGTFEWVEEHAERGFHDMILDDMLTSSRAYAIVVPDFAAWDADPDEHDTWAVRAYADYGDDTRAEEAAARVKRRQEVMKAQNFPVDVRWVQASNVLHYGDHRGLREVWVYERVSVMGCFANYVDADGEPLAKRLYEKWRRENEPENQDEDAPMPSGYTDDQVVVIVTRFDKHCAQTVLVAEDIFQMPGDGTERESVQFYATDSEEISYFEHKMGVVPVAFFPGRQTSSKEPQFRYYSYANAIEELGVTNDVLWTQSVSVGRMIAWPIGVLQRAKESTPPKSGDPTSITLEEGRVWVGGQPGDVLQNYTQLSTSDAAFLTQNRADLRSLIDVQSLPAFAPGQDAASSGYELAQLQAGAESVLQPIEKGASRGYSRMFYLVILAVRVFLRHMRAQCEEAEMPDEEMRDWLSVPVKFSNEDAVKYIRMDERLAEEEWDITVTVKARPTAGELAHIQTVRTKEEAGYISHIEAMMAAGNRNPNRTLDRQLQENIMFNSDVVKVASDLTINLLTKAAQESFRPKQPDQPILTQGIAGAMQTTASQARMPLGPTGMAPPRAAGLPPDQETVQNMAPEPPPAPLPGRAPGQANALGTSSLQMASSILARRGQP